MTTPVRADKALAPRQELPRPIWTVLLSWGLAVLLMAGLFSAWIWSNQQEQDERWRKQAAEDAAVQLEQDRAMCKMIRLFTSGPEPVPGPEGERSRVISSALRAYASTLHCEDFKDQPPVSPRPR